MDRSANRLPASLVAVGVTTLVVAAVAAFAGYTTFGLPGADEPSADESARGATPTDARGVGATAPPPRNGTGTPTPTPTQTQSGANRDAYTVREGANETPVYVSDSGRPGPTVVVVGGQHGNEPAGTLAARAVADWAVDRGTLVVVPEANPRGVRNGTRKVDGRDLNAQFPVGDRPTSAQARALWRVVERHDADAVIDLHSSDGIYGVDGGVGQAIFPTVTGHAVEHADAAIVRVNREYDLTGNRSFRRGNVMGRSGLTLTRKVAGDQNESAYVVETTKRNTSRAQRVAWTKTVTRELLRRHGLVTNHQ
jgi:hypothetical protein